MSRLTIAALSLISWVVVLSACGDDVQRTFVLQPASLTLPHAETELSGDELSITINALEDLEDDFQYVAWAEASGDPVALGAIKPSEPLTVTLSLLGLSSDSLGELSVTEEEAGGVPASPSTRVRLKGTPGSELVYPPLAEVALSSTSASVELHNKRINAQLTGLPTLETGLSYTLWLGFRTGEHVDETPHAEG